MITESAPLINYPILKPVPSYFSPKHKFLQFKPLISGYIMVIDSTNLANVPFVITPIPHKYSPLNLLLSKEFKFIAFKLNSYGILYPFRHFPLH